MTNIVKTVNVLPEWGDCGHTQGLLTFSYLFVNNRYPGDIIFIYLVIFTVVVAELCVKKRRVAPGTGKVFVFNSPILPALSPLRQDTDRCSVRDKHSQPQAPTVAMILYTLSATLGASRRNYSYKKYRFFGD